MRSAVLWLQLQLLQLPALLAVHEDKHFDIDSFEPWRVYFDQNEYVPSGGEIRFEKWNPIYTSISSRGCIPKSHAVRMTGDFMPKQKCMETCFKNQFENVAVLNENNCRCLREMNMKSKPSEDKCRGPGAVYRIFKNPILHSYNEKWNAWYYNIAKGAGSLMPRHKVHKTQITMPRKKCMETCFKNNFEKVAVADLFACWCVSKTKESSHGREDLRYRIYEKPRGYPFDAPETTFRRYDGCYPRSEATKTLDGLVVKFDETKTPNHRDLCVIYCQNYGFMFAGVQAQECRCGNEGPDTRLRKTGIYVCQTPCLPPWNDQSCGGTTEVEIFATTFGMRYHEHKLYKRKPISLQAARVSEKNATVPAGIVSLGGLNTEFMHHTLCMLMCKAIDINYYNHVVLQNNQCKCIPEKMVGTMIAKDEPFDSYKGMWLLPYDHTWYPFYNKKVRPIFKKCPGDPNEACSTTGGQRIIAIQKFFIASSE